jgi:hypothetical protein
LSINLQQMNGLLLKHLSRILRLDILDVQQIWRIFIVFIDFLGIFLVIVEKIHYFCRENDKYKFILYKSLVFINFLIV